MRQDEFARPGSIPSSERTRVDCPAEIAEYSASTRPCRVVHFIPSTAQTVACPKSETIVTGQVIGKRFPARQFACGVFHRRHDEAGSSTLPQSPKCE